jgi:hypothetical protein
MIGDGDCGEIGGMKIGGGTEVLGENLLQPHFVHHKSHMTRPGFEPGPPRWEARTNRLSYGAAQITTNERSRGRFEVWISGNHLDISLSRNFACGRVSMKELLRELRKAEEARQ